MRVAIMQPYFLPYIGYFQLLNAVDTFVVYDNIQYTRKGWINRNRFLRNHADVMFSIPLRKDSDYLNVDQRELAESFDRRKLLNQFREAYRRAPHADSALGVVEAAINCSDTNLFEYVRNSINVVCNYLNISTPIVVSSTVAIDPDLRGADRVVATCESLNADSYVNPIGGTGLYSHEHFSSHGIDLRFLKSDPLDYKQFGTPFVPWLSIIDVMMFNSPAQIAEYLATGYSLVTSGN